MKNMGQAKKITKSELQKEKLKDIFVNMLNTNVSIMRFQMTLTDKSEEIKGLKQFIRMANKAIDIINNVNHIEILISLYNSFIGGKEGYFATLTRVITLKTTIAYWDKSKKGFQEFLQKEEEGRSKSEEELKERQEQQQAIKKAREEGKSVEFIYENGKMKPIIKSN